MNKFVYIILSILACTSCTESVTVKYNIQGSLGNSFVNDGDKLYLSLHSDTASKNIDSCEVVHGAFKFEGKTDTVAIANIGTLPIVLEDGEISIATEGQMVKVTGSPLNEKLSYYLTRRRQIAAELSELSRLPDRAIMNGTDLNEALKEQNDGIIRLTYTEDSLATAFVTENFDNILGVFAFTEYSIRQAQLQGYLLTPWMESIMTKATDKFKNNKDVITIYEEAKKEEETRNGLRQNYQTPAATNPTMPTPMPDAPTPNELAKPAN